MAEYSLGTILAISISLGVLALTAILALTLVAIVAVRQRSQLPRGQSKSPLLSLKALSIFSSKSQKPVAEDIESKLEADELPKATSPDTSNAIKTDQLLNTVAQATSTPNDVNFKKQESPLPIPAAAAKRKSKFPWPLQRHSSEANNITNDQSLVLGSPAFLQFEHGEAVPRRLLRPKSGDSTNSESMIEAADIFGKYKQLKSQHQAESNSTTPRPFHQDQTPATLKAGPNARSEYRKCEEIQVQANSGLLESTSETDISVAQTPPLTVKSPTRSEVLEKPPAVPSSKDLYGSTALPKPIDPSSKDTTAKNLRTDYKPPRHTQITGTPPPPSLPLPVAPLKSHARSFSEPVAKFPLLPKASNKLATLSAQSTPSQQSHKTLPRKASGECPTRNLSQLVTTWERKPSRSSRDSSLRASRYLLTVSREQSPSPDSITFPAKTEVLSQESPSPPLNPSTVQSGSLTPHTRSQLLRTPSLRFPRIWMRHSPLAAVAKTGASTITDSKDVNKIQSPVVASKSLPPGSSTTESHPKRGKEPHSAKSATHHRHAHSDPQVDSKEKAAISPTNGNIPIKKKLSLKRAQLGKPLPTVPGSSPSFPKRRVDVSIHQPHLELRTFSPFIVRLPGNNTTDSRNSPQSSKASDRDKASRQDKLRKASSYFLDAPSGVIANLEGAIYRAEWMYSPRIEDELELVEGDVLEVYQIFDDGWCFARKCQDHKQSGICPMSALAKWANPM